MVDQPISPQGRIIKERLDALGMSTYQFGKIGPVSSKWLYNLYAGRRIIAEDHTIEEVARLLEMESSDPLYLAIDRIPPDVYAAVLRHPRLIEAIRNLAAKWDAEQETP